MPEVVNQGGPFFRIHIMVVQHESLSHMDSKDLYFRGDPSSDFLQFLATQFMQLRDFSFHMNGTFFCSHWPHELAWHWSEFCSLKLVGLEVKLFGFNFRYLILACQRS